MLVPDDSGRVSLPNTDLSVSRIGFGCWPIAGVSSLGVTPEYSYATVHAAIDCGINFFDTAFSYGYNGEADQILAEVLKQRDCSGIVLASKVGTHFDSNRVRQVDGRPETLIHHAEQCVRRLGVSELDILYLHTPDPQVPVSDSAGAIAELVKRGLARYPGVSNVGPDQLQEFCDACPAVVVQQPYNMMQQEGATRLSSRCASNHLTLVAYWVLMKGLLAGHLGRDHAFDPNDKRLTYDVFQGQAWHRSQDLLDQLREIASNLGCTVAQLVVAWTLQQPAIGIVLCGAKRPEQIRDSATAMNVQLSSQIIDEINLAIAQSTPSQGAAEQ